MHEDHRIRQTQLSTAKYACHLQELDILPFLNLLSGKILIRKPSYFQLETQTVRVGPEVTNITGK